MLDPEPTLNQMIGGFRVRRFDALATALVDAFARLILGTLRSNLSGHAPDTVAGGFRPLGCRDLKLLDLESGEADPRFAEVDGRLVWFSGYIVPVEDLQSGTPHFPLAPYVGASIHTPPPPANQALAVDMGGDAVESEVQGQYWVSGRLSIDCVEIPRAPAAFRMEGI